MYVLGLHTDGLLLKLALLRREKHQIHVELVRTLDLQEIKDPFGVLAPLLEKKAALIATGLDTWEVLLREVQVSLKRKKEVLSVLPFQSEGQIPYPLEEAILVPFLQRQGKEFSDITFLSTKKECLEEHLEKMASYKIDPDWVSAVPAALWRYAKSYLSAEVSSIFHLGMEKSCYLSFVQKKLVFSQTIPFGLNHFIEALKEDSSSSSLENLDFALLDPEDFPHLVETMEKFKKEWERIQAFFEKKKLSKDFVFVGDIPQGLRRFLEKGDKLERGDHPSYAIPIGLALDALYQDENSVQLRQNKYTPPRLFKSRMKKLFFTVLSLGVLSSSTWGSSYFFIQSKENALIERTEASQDKKLKKNRVALVQSLRQWSKSLSGQKVPFPYKSTAPSVSRVLAWLSTHPYLTKPDMEIKRLHYVLIKYPTIGKSSLSYAAKLEIEFSSLSPTFAREFHDSLLQGEGLVNPKQEISWNVSGNQYSTTFMLKDIPS